jgi:biotin carboxylase
VKKKPKLMILGAGVFQLAAIKKAVDLGYHVITVDNIPTNIGHRYSHESLNISTVDADAVLRVASDYKIDGIYTMASDIALPTMARVVESLSLSGPSDSHVKALINKNRFRSLQASLDIYAPQFMDVRDIDLAINDWTGGPAIIKPAFSSGSRGVVMLEVVNADSRPYIEKALEYSNNNHACLEEYVEGEDYSVEGFILNNNVRYAFVSKKYTQGFAVIGHKLPSDLSIELYNEIVEQIQKVVNSGIISDGPFDADFRVGEGRVVLLELTPRLGGNGLPVLVEAAYGVSLIEISLRHAMQELNEVADVGLAAKIVPHASLLFYSDSTGTVESMAPSSSIKSNLSNLVDLCVNLQPGQKVERFVHGGNVFGYSIITITENEDIGSLAKRVNSALSIKVNERIVR